MMERESECVRVEKCRSMDGLFIPIGKVETTLGKKEEIKQRSTIAARVLCAVPLYGGARAGVHGRTRNVTATHGECLQFFGQRRFSELEIAASFVAQR